MPRIWIWNCSRSSTSSANFSHEATSPPSSHPAACRTTSVPASNVAQSMNAASAPAWASTTFAPVSAPPPRNGSP